MFFEKERKIRIALFLANCFLFHILDTIKFFWSEIRNSKGIIKWAFCPLNGVLIKLSAVNSKNDFFAITVILCQKYASYI